jgi:beta-lactamase class A
MRWGSVGRFVVVGVVVVLAFLSSSTDLFAGPRRETAARAEIERLTRESGAEVAVAFRTLDGKQKLFIQPGLVFHAASTMKVPVMIELFRQAKAGKLRLDDPLEVRNEFRSVADGSPYQLDPADDSDKDVYRFVGCAMTLRQLCEAMITVSSNLATNLLIEKLGVENIRRTIHRMRADGMQLRRGVEDTRAYERGIINTTTAPALLAMLERLAKGKVVSRGASREMVEILKGQKFNEAIPAGLPAGTPVAHKTGQITRIHHDAAIVYAERPFVLVILVRGIADDKKSAALMAEITRLLYEHTRR